MFKVADLAQVSEASSKPLEFGSLEGWRAVRGGVWTETVRPPVREPVAGRLCVPGATFRLVHAPRVCSSVNQGKSARFISPGGRFQQTWYLSLSLSLI